MEQYKREFLLNRIISQKVKIKIDGQNYYLTPPKPEDKVISIERYYETLRRSEIEGVMSLEETLDYLYEIGQWTEIEEEELENIPEKIEGLKVTYYESFSKGKYKKIIKKNIKDQKDRLEELFSQKNSLIKFTCEGSAESAKIEYLVYSSIEDDGGNKLIDQVAFEEQDGGCISACVEGYTSSMIDAASCRDLVRNDPWKTIWGSSKTGLPLFNIPATEINDNQKILINWSRLYDNIYENMECPSDEVIADDDALDGWLIVQHKKREREKNINEVESRLSDKTKNADEIFVMADGQDDAKKIHSLNNPIGNRVRKQRMNQVSEKGAVDVQDFADVKRRLQIQAVEELSNRR